VSVSDDFRFLNTRGFELPSLPVLPATLPDDLYERISASYSVHLSAARGWITLAFIHHSYLHETRTATLQPDILDALRRRK
jgi:hypothetical protein